MRWRAGVAALFVLAACGNERVVLQPAIDLPAASSDAYPLDVVDSLKLSIGHSGEEDDIAANTGTPDDPPRLESVPFDENLVLHLSGESSGVEIAYGRTCPFSVPSNDTEPHLYFSRVVKWAASRNQPFETTRLHGSSHAFACGAVFLGGDDLDAQVEMFDPTIGDFQLLPLELMRRTATVLAPLPGERALIVGGTDAADRRVDLVEVVNPGVGLVEQNAGPAVTEHAAVVLQDGSVLVAGGRTETEVTGEAWQYELDDAGNLVDPSVIGSMLYPRAGHTMTRLGDELGAGVLIVGGRDTGDNPVQPAELYRPLREAFSEVTAPPEAARYGHRAVRMPGGFVLIVGGFDPSPVRSLLLYDPVEGTFGSAGDMPAGAGLYDNTVTPLPDGRVLIAGGRDENDVKVASVFIARLDPIDGRVIVVATDPMEVPRAGQTAALLGDGTVLVVGGTSDGNARAERYNPPSEGRR